MKAENSEGWKSDEEGGKGCDGMGGEGRRSRRGELWF